MELVSALIEYALESEQQYAEYELILFPIVGTHFWLHYEYRACQINRHIFHKHVIRPGNKPEHNRICKWGHFNWTLDVLKNLPNSIPTSYTSCACWGDSKENVYDIHRYNIVNSAQKTTDMSIYYRIWI